MSRHTHIGLDLVFGLVMAPLDVAAAYLSQLARGSPTSLYAHDRALSRAVNVINARFFSHWLQTLAASRAAVRGAHKIGIPAATLSTADAVLAQQEAILRAKARQTVHLAYAY